MAVALTSVCTRGIIYDVVSGNIKIRLYKGCFSVTDIIFVCELRALY